MKLRILVLLTAMAALLSGAASAEAAVYQWPTPSSSGTMVASTNSTTPSCARADAVIDSWLRAHPESARPVNYDSATACGGTRSSSAYNAGMRVFCSPVNYYYCQASGTWLGYVDWDRVSATKVTVIVKMWRG